MRHFRFSITMLLGGLLLLVSVCSDGQTTPQDDSYAVHIRKKIDNLDKQLSRQSAKYLAHLSRQEQKIIRKLSKLDSAKSVSLSGDAQKTYDRLTEQLRSADGKFGKLTGGKYIPYLDSLQGSLNFLNNARASGASNQIGSSLQQVRQLTQKLHEAENIEQIVQQRQAQLRELVNSYTRLPKSISRDMGKYSQSVYYYGQQLREIKEAVHDPDKLMKKVLGTLSNLPAFQQFMSKHSMLAALFPAPDNTNGPAMLNGLQTRASVQQLLQRQMGTVPGNNPVQYLQQQMQQAQGQLKNVKEKLNELLNNGKADANLPAFKPNSQKTKKFFKRIEIGAGMQTQKASYFFPMRTDLSVSAGYRLSDSKTVGIALNGKIGWGNSWKQVNVTAQGIGSRLFAEWKIKGNFWLAVGAEMNYLRPIDSLEHFKQYRNWTRSALVGVSRQYRISKKVKGKAQLLYDVLYRQNTPPTEAVVFRLGYLF